MSTEKTPMERARDAVNRLPGATWLNSTRAAHVALTAALEDPQLGIRISNWRQHPCEHSRILNPREHADGDTADYEQACSPCLRDRLLAHLLGGVS